MPKRYNVLAILKKSGERYVFFWAPGNQEELLRQFGKFAADPELSFSWYDAAMLSQKVRKWT